MSVRALFIGIVSAATLSLIPAFIPPAPTSALACPSGTYQNSDGQCIPDEQAPTGSGAPPGATAQCRDGTYSFSTHRSGTCSGHGGVAQWL
ncbi:MAG: DUF3761 domain-containing protein [Mycobacterium sp.]|nr:DUF3761 domain-containing protein [Mycobacterium sp.]